MPSAFLQFLSINCPEFFILCSWFTVSCFQLDNAKLSVSNVIFSFEIVVVLQAWCHVSLIIIRTNPKWIIQSFVLQTANQSADKHCRHFKSIFLKLLLGFIAISIQFFWAEWILSLFVHTVCYTCYEIWMFLMNKISASQ